MRQKFLGIAFVLAALMALPGGVLACGSCDYTIDTYDLMAGQNVKVGTVTVEGSEDGITVTLEVGYGWGMTEIHVHVADSLGDVPMNKVGSPKIGQFDVNKEYDPPTTSEFFDFNVGTGQYFVAAHATVCHSTLEDVTDVEDLLPDTVTMKVAYPYPGAPSYFQTTIDDEDVIDGVIDGVHNGWCVDTDHTIGTGYYTAQVFSSYEDLPEGLIEFPENLDLVNWILNQNYVRESSPGSYGTYTYGDVQRAIWALIEDNNSTSGLGSWDEDRVKEILTAAYASGEGFVPGCGGTIAIILRPVDGSGDPVEVQVTIAQVTLAELPVECEITCETAWPDAVEFTDSKSWATYIDYTLSTCTCP